MRMIPARIRYPLPLIRMAEDGDGCGALRGELGGENDDIGGAWTERISDR